MKRPEISHMKGNVKYLCQPRRAKVCPTGIKWWCYICKRYIKIDRKHKLIWKES